MSPPRPFPGVRWATAACRLLLWAYPPRFRRRHGDEMARLFRDRARSVREADGRGGLVRHLPGALTDVALNAAAEWLRGSGNGHPPREGHAMTAGIGKDLRWAVRSLARSPGFAAVALLTIALGVGPTTAIFSVVRSVLLAPLPYDEPDRLVLVWAEMEARQVTDFPLSPPDFDDMRRTTTALEDVAAVITFDQPLASDGEPVQVSVAGVTPNFFDLLGVEPLLGRTFVESDGEPGDPGAGAGGTPALNQMVVLSEGLWRRRWGADPGVVGRVIDLGGGPAEVVGVAPAGFRLLFPPSVDVDPAPDLFAAFRLDYAAQPRGNVFLRVIGRLAPGATLEAANRELDRVAAASREIDPGWAAAGFDLDAVSMHDDLTEDVRPVLLALVGAVAFVLLVACANVANLLLVRASTRGRELSLRAALGGSRARIARQLLAEAFVLAAGGALLGVLLARVGIDVLLLLRPEELPRLDEVRVDGAVLAFTAAAAVGAALLVGLLPALRASRRDLAGALRDRGRSAGAGAHRLLRNGVVVGEVALSLVLLVGAGLMIRSFSALQRVDPGFRADGVVTFSTNLPFARYGDVRERVAFAARLRERLGGVAGVTEVSAAFPLPLDATLFHGRWGLEEDVNDPETYRQADYYAVMPGYFEVLGTRVLEGRVFSDADEADSASVVVVDRTLAERAFPGRSAVGRRIHVRVSSQEPQLVEIVGVVEPQRRTTLAGETREAVYFTHHFAGAINLQRWAVRSALEPASLASAVRREVAALDPRLPVAEMAPLSGRVRAAMASTRFALVLMGAFAGLALVLAAVGLYGVVAFTVRLRTAEIGVRMAFGAERSGILAMVLGRGVALAAVGVALGLVGAVWLTRVMASLLVGVAPTDPVTFVAVPALFLAVAALASLLPALRATRVDPVTALREE